MRKWSWLFLAAGILMMPGGSAAHSSVMPQTAAYPTCAVKKLNISQTGKVTVRGGCTLRGKPIVSRPHYRYTSSDPEGYSCGRTVGVAKAGKFVLGPRGASAASGNVRYLPKAKYRRVASKAKRFRAMMTGSEDLQCGRLVGAQLPDPNVLCGGAPWDDDWQYINWRLPTLFCGWPVPGLLGFAGLPTFVDSRLSVGHLLSRSGLCSYQLIREPFGVQPQQNDLGEGFRYRLACSDGLGALVGFEDIIVYSSAGQECTGYDFRDSPIVTITANWAGSIKVLVGAAVFQGVPYESRLLGTTVAAARLPLSGSQEPC